MDHIQVLIDRARKHFQHGMNCLAQIEKLNGQTPVNQKADLPWEQWFEGAWLIYPERNIVPKKPGKQPARKAFRNIVRSEATWGLMKTALNNFKIHWDSQPVEDRKFIPHMSTWLNRYWRDFIKYENEAPRRDWL